MNTIAKIFLLTLITAFSSQAQWVLSSTGLPNGFGFYEGVNTIAKSGNTLYVSQNKKIFRSTDEGANWIEMTSSFPTDSRYTFLAGNESRMYVAFDTLNGNIRNGRLFYSEDQGATWVETGQIASGGTFSSIVIKDNFIYVHGGSRSIDGGNTWIEFNVPERGSEMSIAENNDLYICSDFHLYRSTDNGVTWIELPGVGAAPSLFLDGNTIYAGSRNELSKSSNNGETWTSIKEGLPTGAIKKTILYVKGDIIIISIGEGSVTYGVFISKDGGLTWNTFNDGYPNTPFTAAIVEHNQYLYSGGGMKGLGNNAGVYKRPASQLTTGIEQISNVPAEFILEQNYPNPFNPNTTINFSVNQTENVSLKIYNTLGEEVASLVNEILPAGSYKINFNAESLSSGVYVYQLSSGNLIQTRKMTLLK